MSTRSSSKPAKAEAPFAAWQGGAMDAMARAGQAYVEGVVELNQELAGFVQARWKRDLELGESLARCRDLSDFTDVQRAWLEEATEQYAAETRKLVELGTKLASMSWDPVQKAMSDPSRSTGS